MQAKRVMSIIADDCYNIPSVAIILPCKRQTVGMYKKTDDNTTLLTIYILVLFEREAYTSSRQTTAQRQQWLPSIWSSQNSEQEAIQT